MRLRILYRVQVLRCRDGHSFDVEIAAGDRAITPGRWLKNESVARLWVARAITNECWHTLRGWRSRRPYLL